MPVFAGLFSEAGSARESARARGRAKLARNPSRCEPLHSDRMAADPMIVLTDVTGWAGWDGIASISIGVLLAAVAWILAAEMKPLLVGEAAPRQERSEIRAAVLSMPEVTAIGRLLTMQLSPHELLVNIDVDLDEGLEGDDIAAVLDRIEAAIRAAVPEASRIFIEPESGV